MKQLKVSAIDSKSWNNNFFRNLRSSKVYIKDVILLSAVFYFLFGLLFSFTRLHFPLFTLFFLAFVLLLINLLGSRRNTEIKSVITAIKAIRNTEFKSSEEILLGSNLNELQDEIREMYSKLKDIIDNLKKLERVRTEFLGNVSHELRTPIFAIQGYIETLLDGALSDEKVNKNFLQKANLYTQNLNSLLNDLIDISMIESGDMRLSFRYFKLSDFINEIVQELEPQAEQKNLELSVILFDEHLQVFGDRNKLKQVFNNLIQNAIKYTETGKIEILVKEEEKSVLITIKDTGIGIASENIDRIFERFYRIDKDRSREVGGTGLGLAIVKHILEAHGTKIKVVSELGKGASFTFSLRK